METISHEKFMPQSMIKYIIIENTNDHLLKHIQYTHTAEKSKKMYDLRAMNTFKESEKLNNKTKIVAAIIFLLFANFELIFSKYSVRCGLFKR